MTVSYNFNLKGRTTNIVEDKKFYTMFSENESRYLYKQLRKIDLNKLTMTAHAQSKTNGINLLTIKKIICNNPAIIEYNENNNSRRIVIKSKENFLIENKGEYKNCFLKIVIDLDNIKIITIWFNRVDEEAKKDDNINLNRYNPNLQIIK